MRLRSDEPIRLGICESVVILAWQERELGDHAGRGLEGAIVHVAEPVSLDTLRRHLALSLPGVQGDRWTNAVAVARTILTPEETFIPILPAGVETRVFEAIDPPAEGDLHFEMPAADTLVLFEFLCREIDERDGANVLAAFVSPAEYLALNALHCVLEKGESYSTLDDYSPQLEAARTTLAASKAS
jgi:hypothetical protein